MRAVSAVVLAVACLAAAPLHAQQAQDTTILPIQEIGTVRIGLTVRGMLEPGDYTMGDGTWADIWYLTVEAGQRATITLRSGQFDAYMQLLDPAGGRITHDDDSGGGNDARITYTFRTAGRYQIVVNTFGDERATGVYTLEVR